MENKLEHQVLFAVYTVALKHTGIVLLILIIPLNFFEEIVFSNIFRVKQNRAL